MKNQEKEFGNARIHKIKTGSLILALFALFFHGSMVFSPTVGIDTEHMLLGSDNFYEIGRFSLVWLSKLLRIYGARFSLPAAGILTLLFLVLCPVLLCLVLDETGGSVFPMVACGLVLVTSPYVTAQLYFTNQSAPVTLSWCLLSLSAYLSLHAKRRKGWAAIFLSGAVLALSLGCYQVNAAVYASICLCCLILSARKGEEGAFRKAAACGVSLLIGLCGYGLLLIATSTKEGRAYLSGSADHSGHALERAFHAGISELSGLPHELYGILFILLLIVTAVGLFREKAVLKKWFICILLELALFACPMSLFLVFGGEVFPRMKFPFSFSLSLMAFLIAWEGEKLIKENREGIWRRLPVVLLAFAGYVLLCDLSSSMRLTSGMRSAEGARYREDLRIAADIRSEIEAQLEMNYVSPQELTQCVFVGAVDTAEPSYAIRYGMYGTSFFVQGAESPNRNRLFEFLEIEDLSFTDEHPYLSQGAGVALMSYLGEQIDAMPFYPAPGYARTVYDEESGVAYFVIKLGPVWRFDGLEE